MLNYRKHICDNHFFLPFLSAVHVCLDHSGYTVVNHFSIDLYCFLQKLVRRTTALDKSKWNKKRKGEMAEVLTEAYMSSEDSEYDESGKLLNYNVKDLAWESPKLKKRKKLLDKLYNKSQSQRSQNRLVKRVRDKTFSIHPKPDDCPTWACDENYTTVG